MTQHAPFAETAAGADVGRQLAQLREVLALVRQIAGRSEPAVTAEAALNHAARASAAYADALPVAQRRFDALIAETAAWAAAGVDALTRSGGPPPAAARLAEELSIAIEELERLLRL